jgi:hypothetical protein
MILDLLERLAEQQAAITAAQVALHRLVELGLDGAVVAQERAVADPASCAGDASAAEQQAICAAPDCRTPVPPQARAGRAKMYCSTRCRSRAASRRTRKRKAEQEAAEDRAQAAAIVGQHAAEGYQTLQWRTPNGAAT